MGTNDDMRIVKGAFDVTIFTVTFTENIKNSFNSTFTPPQPAGSQSSGPKTTKVIDLLNISETFVFGGNIHASATKTAKEVKDDLKQIAKGGGVDGGTPATLYYEDSTFNVYVSDLVIKKITNDNVIAAAGNQEIAEYAVTITLLRGEEVS